jgi:hypothetical protein
VSAWRKAGCTAGLLLPVVAVVYFVVGLRQAARAPDEAAWRSAADVVRAGWNDGDVIVFVPGWAHEGVPAFAGLDVRLGESVDWHELTKLGRVWAAGWTGRDPEDMPEGAFREAERRDLDGGVTVRLYEPAAGRPKLLYDFRPRLEDAKVTRVHKDRREECSVWRDDAWHCGAVHPWQNVGRRRQDMGGAMRDFIWTHPLDKGAPIEIRWPSVPLGTRLVVHFGSTQRAVDSAEAGGPVRFQAKLGNEVFADVEVGKNDPVWHEAVLDTSSRSGQLGEVVITVSAPNYKDRQFGFTGDSWM